MIGSYKKLIFAFLLTFCLFLQILFQILSISKYRAIPQFDPVKNAIPILLCDDDPLRPLCLFQHPNGSIFLLINRNGTITMLSSLTAKYWFNQGDILLTNDADLPYIISQSSGQYILTYSSNYSKICICTSSDLRNFSNPNCNSPSTP